MSYTQRHNWITDITGFVVAFADKHEHAHLSVCIDCGKYECVTIKMKELSKEHPEFMERLMIFFYDDHVVVKGTDYKYEDNVLFIDRLSTFLNAKYQYYF